MFGGGYAGKVLYVNLGTQQSRSEPLNEQEAQCFLGGRGLAALWYFRLQGADVVPLSADNVLVFSTGPLTGTPLPSTTKMALSTRSPETGLYLCSNAGGDFGPDLKSAGYDAIILEGGASQPVYLNILDGEVTFRDARPFLGLTGSKVRAGLLQGSDKRASALYTGPAADRGVRFSTVQVDDGRAFGRGGAGAVMAAKNLKGIVVRGNGDIALAHPRRVREIRGDALRELRQTRAVHTQYGTAQYTEVINELGCFPARNFQSSYLPDAESTYAQVLRECFWIRNAACYRCPVACGKVCEVRDGPFRGARARPEYETIGMFAGSCVLTDLAAVIAANELCDEYGMDTISTANAVALVMELFQRGEMGAADTGGVEVRFGDGQAALQVIEQIGKRRHIGKLLGEGMKRVQEARPEWSPHILAVKGLPAPAYDPRGFHGMGLSYGTSSRGACHNVGGWTIRAELQSGQYDRFALHGKGELVKRIQDTRAYIDSLGLCTVVRSALGFTDQPAGDVMLAVTGHDLTSELMSIGERIYTLERLILNREGARREDDYLPRRFTTEAIPSGPARSRVLTREMYNVMLDEYYSVRGWDSQGVPTPETVQAHGLKDILGKGGNKP